MTDHSDHSEDRPISFALGHDATRLLLAAYQNDGYAISTAFADIERHHPGVTLLQCMRPEIAHRVIPRQRTVSLLSG